MSRSRENQQAEAPGADPFVVLFTALMMILLAFFILLNSIGQVDERRKRLALGSLMGSFGILPAGQGLDTKGEYALNSKPILSGARKGAFLRALGTMFRRSEARGEVQIFMRDGRVVLSFSSDVLFPPGVTEVSPKAFRLLDQVAAAIRTMRQPVRIEGHTDDRPGKSPIDNWRLSVRRAIAVLRYLKDGGRLPAGLLSARGLADTRPGEHHLPRLQRRVEIVFANVMELTGD